MRISDWSSDVCSSDLAQPRVEQAVTLLKSKGRSQICVLEGHAALIGIACAGGQFPRFAQISGVIGRQVHCMLGRLRKGIALGNTWGAFIIFRMQIAIL